jgi:hypothetical protein
MPTSGTISSTMTAAEVITAALQELGVLSAGENPTGEETILGLRSLNWMLKTWSAKGANLWRQDAMTITVPAASATIALDPEVFDIASLRVFTAPNQERWMLRYERAEYMLLPNKATPGNPTIFYLEKQRDGMALFVWPVPRAATTLKADIVRRIEDVTDASQTLDVPQEWLETVYVCLAARLCQSFGATRTDPTTAQVINARAAELEGILLDNDRPSSVFMGSGVAGVEAW